MEENAREASVTPIRNNNILPSGVRAAIARAIAPHLKEGELVGDVVTKVEVELMKSGVDTFAQFAIAKVAEFFKM